LTRRFKETGDIVRVERGTWALREWHPGRNWKKEKEAKSEAAKGDGPADEEVTDQKTSETSQP
jgi:hypothetical protein